MRTTLFLKRGDMILQLLAFGIPLVFAVCIVEPFLLYFIYFFVGAVQLVSCIVNKLLLDPFYRNGSRKYCEACVAGIIVLVVLASLTHVAVIEQVLLFCLLFVTPFMAIWYFWFSVTEMKKIKRMVDRKMYV